MSFDSDVALVGTGAAPLVAAAHLMAEGKSVLLLNPDWDFFLEDSELPFDPLFHSRMDSVRLKQSAAEEALKSLRPGFPGAVEYWSGAHSHVGLRGASLPGFQDRSAPFVRARSRLWVTQKNLEHLEDTYVLASDAGYTPQILEGLQVLKRFPGAPISGDGSSDGLRGLWVPKIYDVDVTRYRNGLLEFVRERSSQVICNATQIETMPDGIRFHSEGRLHTARLRDGLLVFWTPRLTQWVLKQARRCEVAPVLPEGIRLWEQWSLMSRSTLDPGVVGVFGNRAVWAECEGDPTMSGPLNRMAMLNSGPLVSLDSPGMDLFNENSFQSLEAFVYGFLKWEKITVRAMQPRAVFEWDPRKIGSSWTLSKNELRAEVILGCDGPLADVVRVARNACGDWI